MPGEQMKSDLKSRSRETRLGWHESLRRVCAFVREHGRFPIKTGDADEQEVRLAHWRRKWEQVKSIIEATGFYPTQVSDDRSEVNLAGWFLRERTKLRDGLLEEDKVEPLRQLIDMGGRRKPGPRQR